MINLPACGDFQLEFPLVNSFDFEIPIIKPTIIIEHEIALLMATFSPRIVQEKIAVITGWR